ncbi:hypothetical protein [Pseudomonas chlororaphis]|uniref:hypothetical protein n=1 Tax=Pseudomonas chlororaphis TaxID=587753 RepID=UPI000F57AA30|nr:hypothetical protein [Pseudomonas chlororaphis]
MIEIESAFQREIESIDVFQDAVALLREHDIAVALCSSLASPYEVVMKVLLPELDFARTGVKHGCYV